MDREGPERTRDDAAGLWQIIPILRQSFGLASDALDDAIRKTLSGVLARDARPVKGSLTRTNAWEEVQEYGCRNDIVEAAIDEWKAMRRDPDVGDVWFILPEFIDS